MFRQHNVGHIHNIKIDDKTFEILENLKYVIATLGNQN
jgi:hypothetical protein